MGDSSSDEESSSGKDSSSSWGPPRPSAASYSSSSSFSSPDEAGSALGLPQDSGLPSSAANANAPDALPVAAPSLGDVVWAYIPGHPLWPALITKDPSLSVHTKTKSVGRAKIRLFHVEFYADNGARSWLSAKMLFPFKGGVEELLTGDEFHKQVQTNSRIFKSLQQAIRTGRPSWKLVVTEAENAFRLTAPQRMASIKSS